MVLNSDAEESKSRTVFHGNDQKKLLESKISADKFLKVKPGEDANTKGLANAPSNHVLKHEPKTPKYDSGDCTIPKSDTADVFLRNDLSVEKLHNAKSSSTLLNNQPKKEVNHKCSDSACTKEQQMGNVALKEGGNGHNSEPQKKSLPAGIKFSEKIQGISRIGRLRPEAYQRKPSEIPKLISLAKAGIHHRPSTFQSKLPVKTSEKENESRQNETSTRTVKNNTDPVKEVVKSSPEKEPNTSETLEEVLAKDFSYLVPLYEKEFKKVSDVWVNTIYCSLTLRTNLVKLLFQAFPNISTTQFQTEDERLLHCIAHAKSCTKIEAENMLKFVKNLIGSREKTKQEYVTILENKEIAEYYKHNWKKVVKKMTELGEETKHLQTVEPEMQKTKEINENKANEKIRRMEMNIFKKDDEIKKLSQQLDSLRQKQDSYKDSILLRMPDYKEIKAEVQSMMAIQREYDELKAKFLFQNYTYEKKIKDLENLVEEKKKILQKEREMKKHLQTLLDELQDHQKRLSSTIGKEQVDFVLGRSLQDRNKRKEQLWMAAVKLVLKGFLIQMKKLERDRNKMLLEVHTNEDLDSTLGPLCIIQKDNFITSIKQQMNELKKYSNCPEV